MEKNTYDAVVVLNGGAQETGELFEDTKARVVKSLELARHYNILHIIMVGHEAGDMRQFAVDTDPTEHITDILVEDHSHNTIENAHFVKMKFLAPRGWHSIVVVTEQFHLERTRITFELVLGDDYHMDFVASEAPYTPQQRQQLAEQEAYFIDLTKTKLAAIGPDDDAAREEMLESKREVTTNISRLFGSRSPRRAIISMKSVAVVISYNLPKMVERNGKKTGVCRRVEPIG